MLLITGLYSVGACDNHTNMYVLTVTIVLAVLLKTGVGFSKVHLKALQNSIGVYDKTQKMNVCATSNNHSICNLYIVLEIFASCKKIF